MLKQSLFFSLLFLLSCGGVDGVDADSIVDIYKLQDVPEAVQALKENTECLGEDYAINADSVEIVIVKGRYVDCGGATHVLACARPSSITIGEDVLITVPLLKHELGHIMTGEYNHNLPYFSGVQAIFICNGQKTNRRKD